MSKDRLNQINIRLYELQQEQIKLIDEREVLIDEREVIFLDIKKKEYNCVCVSLNKDIDIYTSSEQELANRNGLGIGLVSETLSALRCCNYCFGKGKI